MISGLSIIDHDIGRICNAIQLETAAGYEAIITGFSKDHHCVKKLGASQPFDYNSSSLFPISSRHWKNRAVRAVARALSIGLEPLKICINILGVF